MTKFAILPSLSLALLLTGCPADEHTHAAGSAHHDHTSPQKGGHDDHKAKGGHDDHKAHDHDHKAKGGHDDHKAKGGHDDHKAHDHKGADAHEGHGAHGGGADLDLLAVMRGLEVNMHQLEAGLWRDDLTAVSRAAAAIENHPHVGSKEVQRLKKALGTGFAAFIAADKVTHDAAGVLAKSAAAGNRGDVLVQLAALQSSCVACHDAQRPALRAATSATPQ